MLSSVTETFVPDNCKRVGVIGGTFSPCHLGHLALAAAAMQELALDTVIFIPCMRSPHKSSAYTAADHRVAMLQLAIADKPAYRISMIEIQRGGTSYTIDTLAVIRNKLPLLFIAYIIGGDTFTQLPSWKDYPKHLSLVSFAVGGRMIDGQRNTIPASAQINGCGHYIKLSSRLPDISATDIRNRISSGKNCAQLVPDSISTYIENHRLYQIGQTDT